MVRIVLITIMKNKKILVITTRMKKFFFPFLHRTRGLVAFRLRGEGAFP